MGRIRRMRKRDLAILNDLTRFRCLTRDDIIELHFSNLKNPVTCCNTVLKRLRRDCHIEANTSQQPFIYFLAPAPIKKDSTKIPHFLRIVDFYKQIKKHEDPHTFIVEPKYGKGFMEPDAFMRFKKRPFFVEIQRTIYSERTMNEKVKRYEAYYYREEWKNEAWQPKERKPIFPRIVMITDTRYNIESSVIKIIQTPSVEEFVEGLAPVQPPKQIKQEPSTGIQVNSGNLRYKAL